MLIQVWEAEILSVLLMCLVSWLQQGSQFHFQTERREIDSARDLILLKKHQNNNKQTDTSIVTRSWIFPPATDLHTWRYLWLCADTENLAAVPLIIACCACSACCAWCVWCAHSYIPFNCFLSSLLVSLLAGARFAQVSFQWLPLPDAVLSLHVLFYYTLQCHDLSILQYSSKDN